MKNNAGNKMLSLLLAAVLLLGMLPAAIMTAETQPVADIQVLGKSGETGAAEGADKLFDGNCQGTKWCVEGNTGWVVFDIKAPLKIGKIKAYHAGQSSNNWDANNAGNTKAYALQVFNGTDVPAESDFSDDNKWTTIGEETNNTEPIKETTVTMTAPARYFRLNVTENGAPSDANAIRFYELELFVSEQLADPVTISFNCGEGSGEMPSVQWENNTEYTLPECLFTAPTDKKFDGWSLNGGIKQPGETITVTGDTVLTAAWKAIEYVTISFAPGEGSGSMAPVQWDKEEEYTLPECTFQSPDGKIFAGWQIGDDTNALPAGNKISVSGNIILTAVWMELTGTPVTQNDTEWNGGLRVVNGNVTVANQITVKGNVTLQLTENCKLTASQGILVANGATLTIKGKGTLEATGQSTWYPAIGANTNNETISNVIIEDGIIVARGSDSGDAIGGTLCNVEIRGGDIKATAAGSAIGDSYQNQKSERTSLKISGGTIQAVCTGEGTATTAAIGGFGNCDISITGGTVTAKTQGEECEGVAIGSCRGAEGVSVEIGGTAKVKAISEAPNSPAIGGHVQANDTTKVTIGGSTEVEAEGKGFVVIGQEKMWNQDIGDVTISEQARVTAVNKTSGNLAISKNKQDQWSGFVSEDGGINYIVYGSPTLTVDFALNSGSTLTVPADASLTVAAALSSSGTVVNEGTIINDGNISDSGTLTNNGTIKVKLLLNANGGEFAGGQTALTEYGIFEQTVQDFGVERIGFSFNGWLDAAVDGSQITSVPLNPISLYAHWNVNQYTVTYTVDDEPYMVDDGEGNMIPCVQTYDYGATVTAPEYTVPVPEGHTFSGWNVPETMPAENITLNATLELNTYTVTWKNYDGETLETDYDVPYGTIPEYNGETPKKPDDRYYIYSFAGWDPEPVPIKADAEYTAKFTPVEKDAAFVGNNLRVYQDIKIGFCVKLTEAARNAANAEMVFTVGSEPARTIRVPFSEAEPVTFNGMDCYLFFCPMNAKEMADEVTAQFVADGINSTDTKTCSVRIYAQKVFAHPELYPADGSLAMLMKSMLNYGAAAQALFDYNTDDPANSILESDDKTVPEVNFAELGYGAEATGSLPEGVTCEASLVLEDLVKVHFIISGSTEGLTFKLDGREVAPVTENGVTYVETEGLYTVQLNKKFNFTISSAVGTWSVDYGAFDYGAAVQQTGTDTNLIKVMQAMYGYFLKANAYWQEINAPATGV